MFIYKIENKLNGKCYVGQTTQTIEQRWYRHQYEANKRKTVHPFYEAIRKYGTEKFILTRLDEANSLSELNQKEEYWISVNNTLHPKGYNLLPGGNNRNLSEETKAKIREKRKKQVLTESQLNVLREGRKIRQKTPGNKQSYFFVKAINTVSGKEYSFSSIKKLEAFGFNSPSISTAIKLKKTHKGYYWTRISKSEFEQSPSKNQKIVPFIRMYKCIDTNKTYSFKELVSSGFSANNVTQVCAGAKKTHAGFHWKHEIVPVMASDLIPH